MFSSLKASVTKHLGWGATVTTTEAVAGSIKAEQRRPHGEEEGKTERRWDYERKKNWERQRTETHKTETNTSSKPRKPTLISSSSIAACKPKKKEEPEDRNKKTQRRNQNQFKAGRPLHHLLSFKVAEKTKGTYRQVSAERRQREAASEDPSAL
jgi:hypothetical protein